MDKLTIRQRFDKIYNHEYDAPPEIPGKEYESTLIFLTFLGDSVMGMTESQMLGAVKIYQSFKINLSILKTVQDQSVPEDKQDYMMTLTEKGQMLANNPSADFSDLI